MEADARPKRKFLLILAGWVLAVVLVLCFLPTSVHKSRTDQCAICGAHRTKGIKYLFGIPHGRYEHAPSRSYITTRYHHLIGLPHEHEWLYRSMSESRGSVLGGGRTSHGDAHPFRLLLLRRALRAIEADFKDSPKEFRQELFQRMIRAKSFDEFYEILGQIRTELK